MLLSPSDSCLTLGSTFHFDLCSPENSSWRMWGWGGCRKTVLVSCLFVRPLCPESGRHVCESPPRVPGHVWGEGRGTDGCRAPPSAGWGQGRPRSLAPASPGSAPAGWLPPAPETRGWEAGLGIFIINTKKSIVLYRCWAVTEKSIAFNIFHSWRICNFVKIFRPIFCC